jgi:hypothetical protein
LSSHSRQPGPPGPHAVEELEELDDDAIVAQQSAAHAPPTRAQVIVEDRSVVVADLPPEIDPSEVMATRQLNAMPGSRDPTVVLRRPVPKPPTRPNWLIWGIWIFAGLLAFAFGGLLALLSARGEAPHESPAVAPPPNPAATPAR